GRRECARILWSRSSYLRRSGADCGEPVRRNQRANLRQDVMITANEWRPGVPQTPGYFERRVRLLRITVPSIRVVRWKGHLVWNHQHDTGNFKYVREFSLIDRLFYEYRRING